MKDRPEPERIEIELTSNVDPGSGELGDDIVVSGSSDHAARPPMPVQPDQRRVFAVAAVVGVLALLLGWLIGRSAGGDEVATTSVTTPETTEAVAETVMPGDTLPSAATTTSRPRRTTTTTTLAPPAVEAIAIDPRLTGVELTLVGSEGGDEIVELDLAEQTLTRRDVGRSFESDMLIVGDDWIVAFDGGGWGGDMWITLLRDGELPERLDLGEIWELLWQEGTDRFWRPDRESYGFQGPSTYEEIDITGEPTGATLELPFSTWVERTDPIGGLVVEVSGKHYSVSESGVVQIATGEMLGMSADIAVTRECDEQLRCGVFVTDRQTGDVRELELELPGDSPTSIESIYGWGPPGRGRTVSPDGTMCLVLLLSEPSELLLSESSELLALIDLRSGAVVELGEAWWMPAVEWSPDGRFVFFLGGGGGFDGPAPAGLHAYDRDTGDQFPVSGERLMWESLGARPVAGDTTGEP